MVEKSHDRVTGEGPVHEHVCPDGHTWRCDSPYCSSKGLQCPDHGGFEPITIGREPWRR